MFNRIYFVLPPRCIVFRFCDFTYSGLIDILVQALVAILWDFLNTLTMSLPIARVWIGSIVGIYIFKFKVFKIFRFALPPRCIVENRVILGRKNESCGNGLECFGDVGASKSTQNNYMNIKSYFKIVFLLKYRFLPYFTVFM